MKLTAEAAERLNDERTSTSTSMNGVIKEIYGDNSLAQLTKKPLNACVLDQDGFIACGPVVGYERPSNPMKPIIKDLDEGKPVKPQKTTRLHLRSR